MNELKLGFDAKRLLYNSSGLGNYSRTLVKNLHTYFPELDISLFAPLKKSDPNIDHSSFKDLYLIQPSNNIFWRYTFINKDIRRRGINVFHGLSNELPLGIEKIKYLKKVVTIHDLIFLVHPEWYPWMDTIIYKEKFKRACRTADRVIAISENTKQDIIKYFDTPEEKIEVVYQACDGIFYDSEPLPAPILHKKSDRPYFLFVSSISKRKNLENVIEALKLIPENNRPLLVVVGGGGTEKSKIKEWVGHIGLVNDIEFLDFVSNERLTALYQHASFSIYPSLYEGFGIPIIESLLSGTPVITSHTSSMPEAGMDIAHYIDPKSIIEIKESIERVLTFSKLSVEDVKKVKKYFDPKGTTEKLMSLYQT